MGCSTYLGLGWRYQPLAPGHPASICDIGVNQSKLVVDARNVQGWKLALAHSPMRVSSTSGEWKSQVTRPVWRVEFSCSGK